MSTSTSQWWLWNILSWSHTLPTAIASSSMISHNYYCANNFFCHCFTWISTFTPVFIPGVCLIIYVTYLNICHTFEWNKTKIGGSIAHTHTDRDSVGAEQPINKIKPHFGRWYIFLQLEYLRYILHLHR